MYKQYGQYKQYETVQILLFLNSILIVKSGTINWTKKSMVGFIPGPKHTSIGN